MDALFVIKQILSPEQLAEVRALIEGAEFVEGKSTAKGMARNVKNNEQVLAESVPDLLPLLSKLVANNALFKALSIPRAVSGVVVSRYREGMDYGFHTDTAVLSSGTRADLSFTLFLSDPASYDGGELALQTPLGEQRLKLEAGSLVLYSTGELHRVNPVTRGERLAVVGWVQSRVRDARKRQILIDLDTARKIWLEKVGHDATADLLLKSSTNLRRLWDE